jgi:hypothetical protein
MCKELPVISQQGGVPEKNNQKKWKAEEEERQRGSLTPQKTYPNLNKQYLFGNT